MDALTVLTIIGVIASLSGLAISLYVLAWAMRSPDS